MSKFKIIDESGDRKYFTIIPNYIYNHSTIYDREVYCQMKRIAGETGTCWTSRKTLAKQCGISVDRLKKSIKYLIEHKWIEFLGKKEVMTAGGKQEVNEYAMCDLWNMNNKFYQEKFKGGSSETLPLVKGGCEKTPRGVVEDAKGGLSGNPKEEPLNNNPIKKTISKDIEQAKVEYGRDDINWLLREFELIMGFKPSSNKDRIFATHLLRNFPKEQLTTMLNFCSHDEYSRIGSLEKMWFKRGDIIAGLKSEFNKQSNKLTIV